MGKLWGGVDWSSVDTHTVKKSFSEQEEKLQQPEDSRKTTTMTRMKRRIKNPGENLPQTFYFHFVSFLLHYSAIEKSDFLLSGVPSAVPIKHMSDHNDVHPIAKFPANTSMLLLPRVWQQYAKPHIVTACLACEVIPRAHQRNCNTVNTYERWQLLKDFTNSFLTCCWKHHHVIAIWM